MMNGIVLSHGYSPLTILEEMRDNFERKLVEDVRNFGSKDIIGASNPGLYHDHENNQYQHETQIS